MNKNIRNERSMLVGGMGEIAYELDGKPRKEKIKFVGKFCHIEDLKKKDEETYFEGTVFDMSNNLNGEVKWNKKEFYSISKFFTELF